MNEMVNKCYSCDFHRQECTFTLGGAAVELQSKKRKLDDLVTDDVESKRYEIKYLYPHWSATSPSLI